MLYLDTSFAVALLITEAHSEQATRWLEAADPPLAVSAWVETEVSSALAANVRMHVITEQMQADALALWQIISREAPVRPSRC